MRRRYTSLRHALLLLAIPLALSGTGYALFTQNLAINTHATQPAYVATSNLLMTYTTSTGSQGSKIVYTETITIKYNGTATITAWQLMFDMPSDFTQFSCASTVSCSTSGVTATIVNGSGNGTINPGGTVTFTVNFTSYTAGYILQNIHVSGTLALTYQTMSGLTMSVSAGTRTKSGKWYYWPYTFTVTNNTGQFLRGWRIQASWSSSTNAVSSMGSTVSYTTSTTQLTILSMAGISTGTSFQFNGTLGSTRSTWTLSGYSIQGAL